MNNAPIYGCSGCNSTGGRNACPEHATKEFTGIFSETSNFVREKKEECNCKCHILYCSECIKNH